MRAPTTAELRNLSASELGALGETSLREHIAAQAMVAHYKYSPLSREKLEKLFHDPECVRYPTRLVFEFGDMAMHQFGQPDLDWRNQEASGRVLYLRPMLAARPDLVVLAAAYFIPVINYGDIITDAHCICYGATLLGMMEQEYYSRICELADTVGAEPLLAETRNADSPSQNSSCDGH